MDEKRRPLYIPVKTLDSEDYIEGIGKLEVALIGAGVMVGITTGRIIAMLFSHSICGWSCNRDSFYWSI